MAANDLDEAIQKKFSMEVFYKSSEHEESL